MKYVTILSINGKFVDAPESSTVLEAARIANIKIPTLCNYEGISGIGSCRLCVVEVEGI
ncbi:2Fe-2S iron-sulfur cluster binding domain-containing protein, partial [Candidatus Bathyarchaeota archaeon]|nr:2Fe-2S iron-sulfur cluster binding domain-containing protein [Candidatus Bathyarchaeota archaeon]